MERGLENEPYHHCQLYMDLIHVCAGCKVYTTKTSCCVDNCLLQGWIHSCYRLGNWPPSSCRSITHSHADYLHGGTKTEINASLHLSDISYTYG